MDERLKRTALLLIEYHDPFYHGQYASCIRDLLQALEQREAPLNTDATWPYDIRVAEDLNRP